MIRLEDYRFYSHHGVDLGAIRDAWMINSSIGRTAVGGSTIPMQLARNLFLTPRKTYLRKYVEALIALEMSLVLPKDRILELYLNVIEWGKGIFGIGAASAYYFKTGRRGAGPGRAAPPGDHHHQSAALRRAVFFEERADVSALCVPALAFSRSHGGADRPARAQCAPLRTRRMPLDGAVRAATPAASRP